MTIALSWQPLPARLGIAGVRPVPTNLRNDLRDWIFAVADKPTQHVDRIISRLNLRFSVDQAPPPPQGTDPTQLLLHNSTHSYSIRLRKALAYNTADRRVIEIVDVLLDLMPPSREPTAMGRFRRAFYTDHRTKLRQLLDDARSPYRVADDGRSLVLQASAVATAGYQRVLVDVQTSASVGSADLHLSAAWDCVYGPTIDAPKAYGEAIKAVEAAGHALIEPNNRLATLGTMLRCLRNAPHKFRLAIPGPSGAGDIEALIAVVALLWTGQTSRHGAQTPTRPETLVEAKMAVYLAVMLVEWFSCGGLIRLP